MKGHAMLSEKWLQQLIANEPGLLGLGDLELKDQERNHPRAGRLDMLLYEAETNTRYEVELQLGATDESHIIRTIEYWDIERRRYPQYDHVGVIVAEEITARFFNVIGLFNGFIPLVAVQMSAIEVAGALTVVFTTVLDRTALGVEEDEEPDEPRDRSYWEQRASKDSLALVNRLLGMVHEVEPAIELKYNKNYIGLSRSGVASNFLTFRPRKQHVILQVKIPRTEEMTQRLSDAGLELLTYSSRWGLYQLALREPDLAEHREQLQELVRLARDSYDS
jgi:hypothetical protein